MQTFKKEERRCHPRVEKQIYIRPNSVFGREHCVYNISLGGMRVHSQKNIQLGEVLRIKISFSGGEWTEVNVRVIWIRRRHDDSLRQFDIGCEFVDLPLDIQNELWILLDRESSVH